MGSVNSDSTKIFDYTAALDSATTPTKICVWATGNGDTDVNGKYLEGEISFGSNKPNINSTLKTGTTPTTC